MTRELNRLLHAIVTLAIDCGYPNFFLASMAIGTAALIVLIVQVLVAL